MFFFRLPACLQAGVLRPKIGQFSVDFFESEFRAAFYIV
jgi:hypothetical protein